MMSESMTLKLKENLVGEITIVGTGCSQKFSTHAVRDAKKKKADNFEAEVLDINDFLLALRLAVNHWIGLQLC